MRDVTDTHFGTAVADPYRYFEDLKNPEVAGWMKAEAEYAKAVLRKIPGRDVLLKEVTTRGDAASARVTSVQVVGSKVYYQKRRATDNLYKLYVRDGFRGSERLLVDPESDQEPRPTSITRSITTRHRPTTAIWPMVFRRPAPRKASCTSWISRPARKQAT